MQPNDENKISGNQAPCCCGDSPAVGNTQSISKASCCEGDAGVKGAAASGAEVGCGCGSSPEGRCPVKTLLTVLVILAAVGIAIYSLMAPT
jgi:hypothetical protein